MAEIGYVASYRHGNRLVLLSYPAAVNNKCRTLDFICDKGDNNRRCLLGETLFERFIFDGNIPQWVANLWLIAHLPMAHSSRGLGRRPLKAEITGSNPVCATNSNQQKITLWIYRWQNT